MDWKGQAYKKSTQLKDSVFDQVRDDSGLG